MRKFFLAASAIIFLQSTAMEQQALITDSQELYDAVYHPRSQEQLNRFLISKQKAQEASDLRGIEQLAIDPYDPCIRSTQELITHSLKKHNYTRAALWCEYAMRQSWFSGTRPHPAIALTLAGLLDSADELTINTPLANINPLDRQEKIYEYLKFAAFPHPLPCDAEGNARFFLLPEAQKQLHAYEKTRFERIQTTTDDLLKALPANDLKDFEELHTLPSACFFIQKYLQGTPSTNKDFNPALALHHATSVVDSDRCSEYFKQSGVYELIHTYANVKKPNKDQIAALLLLADIEEDTARALEYVNTVVKNLHKVPTNDFAYLAQKTACIIESALSEFHPQSLICLCEFIASQGYKNYRKILVQDSAAARDYAQQILLWNQRAVFEQKALDNSKLKSEAFSLLHDAAQAGDVHAYWKLLAHKQLAESDMHLLLEAIEKTKLYHAPERLKDVEQALANVATCDSASMRVAVAHLYATGIEGCVKKDQQKALKCCALAGKEGVKKLIALESEIDDPLVAFHAALHLQLNQTSYCIENLVKSRDAYLLKARSQADEKLSKEIIIRCFSDAGLYFHGMYALGDLCEKYGNDLHFWSREREFVNIVLDRLMALADAGDPRAASFLGSFLESTQEIITHPSIPDCAQRARYYKEKAAFAGDQKSLFELADNYQDLIGLAQTDEEYGKASRYFAMVYHAAAGLHDELEKKKWQELAVSKTLALMRFHDTLTHEKVIKDKDPAFHYYCMVTLADSHPQETIECLSKAESFMVTGRLNPSLANLIEKTGASACIGKHYANKVGWAYYAKAIVKLCRTPLDVSGAIQSYKTNIKNNKEIVKLLEQAQHADQPFCNQEIVEESKILHLLATQYLFVAQKSGAATEAEKKAYANALKYYERATKAGCLKSEFAWADVILSKKRAGDGQIIFEKAISNLITAAEKNYEPAKNKLSDIYREGFEVVPLCGGVMTAELYSRIKKVMNVVQPNVLPELSRFDELLTDTAKGIKHLQNGQYEPAYTFFKAQADKGDLTAMVYLGIMHRDGLSVERSPHKAHDYFTQALLHWNPSDYKYFSSLAPAHEALGEYAYENLDARIARGLFIAGLAMNVSNAQRQAAPLIWEFKEAEKLACKSTHEEDHNRIFTSGLAERINTILEIDAPMTILVEVVSSYAHRVSKIGVPDSAELLMQLFQPMSLMTKLLADVVENSNPIDCFQGISQDSLKGLIINLHAAINASPKKSSPNLQYLLGLIHLCGAHAHRQSASIRSGLELIKSAAERNSAPAMHTWGWLNMYGHVFSKEVPTNRKVGIAILEKLAKEDDLRGLVTLAKYYYSEKNDSKKTIKKATEYLEAVLKKDSKNHEAAFLLAEIYSQHPSLIHHDYSRAYDLFELSSSNFQLTASAHLYQLFLTLDRGCTCMKTEQIVKKLLGVMQTVTLHQDNVKALINGLTMDFKFDVTLNKWLEAQKSILTSTQEAPILAQIYGAVAWWHLIMAKLRAEAKQPFDKDCVLASEYLIHAIKLSDCPIGAHCLQAAMCMQPCYRRVNLAEAKKNILLACSFLGKNGLKLKDEPLLQKTITEYKKAKTSNFVIPEGAGRDFSIIMPESEFMKLSADIDLITKIEKQYS